MTEDEFMALARAAARRATNDHGRIGNLIFTQTRNLNEPTLREPEMRTAFQQEADERAVVYGIEVPTKYPYKFTGIDARRALTDFALLDAYSVNGIRNVLVEFKQGQPNRVVSKVDASIDHPTITKDLRKLWAEPVRYGRCMFHICQSANAGTLTELERKYNIVTQNARDLADKTIADNPKVDRSGADENAWFLLLILVLHERRGTKGSYLHRATWNGSKWAFLQPELLQPVGTGSAATDDNSPATA